MNESKTVDMTLDCSEPQWVYVGDPQWKYDRDGVIFSPAWQDAELSYASLAHPYGFDQARENYAFFTGTPMADVEIKVAYRPYMCGSGSVVFRAVDSARCYVVDIIDMGRKGSKHELTLWLQDETGYRRCLASGLAPHSQIPDLVQGAPKNTEEWFSSSPEWVQLQVRATGSRIEVAVDGQTIIAVEDDTYAAGYVGLQAIGPVLFSDLRLKGTRCEPAEPWKLHEGQLPRFVYPGLNPPKGFNAWPLVAAKGETVFVAWAHGLHRAWINALLLTRSDDGGLTWTPPEPVAHPLIKRDSRDDISQSLFIHDDDRLSCLINYQQDGSKDFGFINSVDGGVTWSGPVAFRPGGKICSDDFEPYAPIIRLSDGTQVMTGYEWVKQGGEDRNDTRRDRSVLFRSTDDGLTWSAPIYFDEENFDHNECMVAEPFPGKLVAFMRTLRAPYMWTSSSADGGLTWTKLVQSKVTGECPYLLTHSSGALLMTSRNNGTVLKLSFDQGHSWATYRISSASAMVGMAELADGTVFIAMHESYRQGAYIRGQRFRVTKDGPVPVPLT